MDSKIIALQCPACGNSCNIQVKDARFGFQIACSYCRTQSMLVINQQLYCPKPHEHVCLSCGRVARPGARFCQCRKSLLKACRLCRAEFPVDFEICDSCGTPADPNFISIEDCAEDELNEKEPKGDL
jgi:hypothetical protein